jgi:hypothetical protein
MKTETLLNFQYFDGKDTTYCVRATEYEAIYGPNKGTKVWRLTVIDVDAHTTTVPASRNEALYLAEAKMKGFIERLKLKFGD